MSYRKLCIAVVLVAGLGNAGCLKNNSPQPNFVNTQDEAAAVLVSVTNVAPWDQVSSAMQPNFVLTGEQALTKVLPTTQRQQEQVLKAFGASLGIGLPQSFSESTTARTGSNITTSTTAAAGTVIGGTSTTGNTSSTTDTTKPGSPPTPSSGAPAGGQLPMTGTSLAGDIGIDPELQYRAAQSLFESVQMMNRQTKYAAMLRNYVPYLVRLRVTVMPYRQNLGYALHLRIGFFPSCSDCPGGVNVPTPLGGGNVGGTSSGGHAVGGWGSPQTTLGVQIPGIEELSQVGKIESKTSPLARDKLATDIPKTDDSISLGLPQVVPILAADDIERALKSRASEVAQQVGFALNAMVQGVGANAGINNLEQSLNAISGQDFNSRLTVSRQSDNTLYVRIGATNQASAGMALTTQNYDIALILLAPRGYFGDPKDSIQQCERRIQIVTHTQFRDTLKGDVLADRPHQTLVKQGDRVMEQILAHPNRKDMLDKWKALDVRSREIVTRELASPIQASDPKKFRELLNRPFKGAQEFSLADLSNDERISLWVAASTALADTALKSAFFELCCPGPLVIRGQPALLFDDTKESAYVQLQASSGTSTTAIEAKLNFKTGGEDVELPAQKISIDPSSHALGLTFPSPKRWFPKLATDSAMTVDISKGDCPKETLCPNLEVVKSRFGPPFRVVYTSAPPSSLVPSWLLTRTVEVIVLDKRSPTGTVSVAVSKIPSDGQSVTVSLSGARVVSVTDAEGATLKLTGEGVLLTKDTVMNFQLASLVNGQKVTVEANGKKDSKTTGKRTLEFSVVSAKGHGKPQNN